MSTYDGDSTDFASTYWTFVAGGPPQYTIYKGHSKSGHTDYYGDLDKSDFGVENNGTYDVTSSGNTITYVYDVSTGNYVYSSNSSCIC